MSTPEDYSDADLRRRRRGRGKKSAEQQHEADLRWFMAQKQGRRLMWKWLERAGIYHTSFSTHSGEMSFKEGRRSFGLELTAELVANAPAEFDLMHVENRPARGRNPNEDTDDE